MQKFLSAAFTIAIFGFLPHEASAQKVNFEKQVWPIIDSKCVQCHKAPYEENGRVKKPKAGLRLDGAWAIMMGGEGGASLEAGKSDHSELYFRVTLPEDDDDFMASNRESRSPLG